MAVLEIPITVTGPHFDFQVELEGVSYSFELRWNGRDPAWYISTLTAEGELIVASRKVALGMSLTGRVRDERLPPGFLSAYDTTSRNIEPGFHDLGRRVQLIYVESADLL